MSDALLHHLQVASAQVLELPDVLSEVPRRVDHVTRGPGLYYARHLAHVTYVAIATQWRSRDWQRHITAGVPVAYDHITSYI